MSCFEVLCSGSHCVRCVPSVFTGQPRRRSLYRLSYQPSQPPSTWTVKSRSRGRLIVKASETEETLVNRNAVKKKSSVSREYLSTILERQYSIGLFGALAVVAGIQVINPSAAKERRARRAASKQVEKDVDLSNEKEFTKDSRAAQSESVADEEPEIKAPEPLISASLLDTKLPSAGVDEPQELQGSLSARAEDNVRAPSEETNVVSGNGASTNGAEQEKIQDEIKASSQSEDLNKENEVTQSDNRFEVSEGSDEEEVNTSDLQSPAKGDVRSKDTSTDLQSLAFEEQIEEPVIAEQESVSAADTPEVIVNGGNAPSTDTPVSLPEEPNQTESTSPEYERVPLVKESAINPPSFYRQSRQKITGSANRNANNGSQDGTKIGHVEEGSRLSRLSKMHGVQELVKHRTGLAVFISSVLLVYMLLKWIVGVFYRGSSTNTQKIIHNEVAQSVTVTRPSIYDLYEAIESDTEMDSDGGGYTTEDRDAADYAADDEDEPTDKDEGAAI